MNGITEFKLSNYIKIRNYLCLVSSVYLNVCGSQILTVKEKIALNGNDR